MFLLLHQERVLCTTAGSRETSARKRREPPQLFNVLARSLLRSQRTLKAGNPRSATGRTTRAGPLSNRALRVAWKAGRFRAAKLFRAPRAKETWGITFSSRQETQNAKFANKTSTQNCICLGARRVAAIARLTAIGLVKRPQST